MNFEGYFKIKLSYRKKNLLRVNISNITARVTYEVNYNGRKSSYQATAYDKDIITTMEHQ